MFQTLGRGGKRDRDSLLCYPAILHDPCGRIITWDVGGTLQSSFLSFNLRTWKWLSHIYCNFCVWLCMSRKKPLSRIFLLRICMSAQKWQFWRKKPHFVQLSHGVACKNCSIQWNGHIAQMYSLYINVNSEEPFHVHMFSYLDPYFLKSHHAM